MKRTNLALAIILSVFMADITGINPTKHKQDYYGDPGRDSDGRMLYEYYDLNGKIIHSDYHEIRFTNGAVLQYRSRIDPIDRLESLLDESNFRFLECDTWRVN